METPKTNHITKKDYEHIYEPAEDTFLLLDAIESDLEFIKNLKPIICVEIGCGSGVIITALSKTFKNQSFCLATDINNKACTITKQTALCNMTSVDTLNMNFVDYFKNNLIDVLIFNPPYVATNSNEEMKIFSNQDIVSSWSGGINGTIIINKLISKLKHILSLNGVFYLLLLKENKPNEIIKKLKDDQFNAIILMERKIPGEHLFVLKITNMNF